MFFDAGTHCSLNVKASNAFCAEAQLGSEEESSDSAEQKSMPEDAASATQLPVPQTPAAAAGQVIDISEPYDEQIHGPLQRPQPNQHPRTMPQKQPLHAQSQQNPEAANAASPKRLHDTMPGKPKACHAADQHTFSIGHAAATQSAEQSPKRQTGLQQLQLPAVRSAERKSQRQTTLKHSQDPAETARQPDFASSKPTQSMSELQRDQRSLMYNGRLHSGANHTQVDAQSSTTAAFTTDDGDFERMMARFDDLAQQEAAEAASSAAGWLFSNFPFVFMVVSISCSSC